MEVFKKFFEANFYLQKCHNTSSGRQLLLVSLTFSAWTNNNAYCSAITYTTSALPGFVSFNAATRTFSYSTSTAGDIGTHSITITGTSSTTVGSSLSFTNTHTFTIDV